MNPPPRLRFANRQRAVKISLRQISRLARLALPECLLAARAGSPLPRLKEIEVTVLSDAAIGRVHAEFFRDPAPTDVITFQHGEILLGAGVIARHAAAHGEPVGREALRCVVHGLLHLGGWQDSTGARRRRMFLQQEAILRRVWPKRLDTPPSRG